LSTDLITFICWVVKGNAVAYKVGKFTSDDFDIFSIPDDLDEPALGLFDSQTQQRRLIFRSKEAVLTLEECNAVISTVEEYISTSNGESD